MYEDFLENYCKKHEISEEKALTHAIVKEFMREKKNVDAEMSKMQGRPKSNRC